MCGIPPPLSHLLSFAGLTLRTPPECALERGFATGSQNMEKSFAVVKNPPHVVSVGSSVGWLSCLLLWWLAIFALGWMDHTSLVCILFPLHGQQSGSQKTTPERINYYIPPRPWVKCTPVDADKRLPPGVCSGHLVNFFWLTSKRTKQTWVETTQVKTF